MRRHVEPRLRAAAACQRGTAALFALHTAWGRLPADTRLLFAARALRMTAYGGIAVSLLPFLAAVGLSDVEVGRLLTSILLGDLAITAHLTTRADSVYGRRRTLCVGAALKVFAGLTFAATSNVWLLGLAGTVGVISSSGGEIGPFLAVEQAALTTLALAARGAGGAGEGAGGAPPPPDIATLFGWFNAVAYASLAVGALLSGCLISALQASSLTDVPGSYRAVLLLYALLACGKGALYARLSPAVEVEAEGGAEGGTARAGGGEAAPPPPPSLLLRLSGLHSTESALVVARLSLLFALDAFAGGFCMQTFVVWWYGRTWGMEAGELGVMMSLANILAGGSGVLASRLVRTLGAVPTMVATHLPSNILLLLIPAAQSAPLAVALLLARFCLSQMDVPARQAYVASVVGAKERSAANGLTNTVRSLGLALAPLPLGYLASAPVGTLPHAAPFLIAGGLKIVYDLSLYALWRAGGAGRDVAGVLGGGARVVGHCRPRPPLQTRGKGGSGKAWTRRRRRRSA